MLLIVALMMFFCLVGLAARRFDSGARWLLVVGVVALVMVNLAMRTLP